MKSLTRDRQADETALSLAQEGYSLRAIGKFLGVSGERVRQRLKRLREEGTDVPPAVLGSTTTVDPLRVVAACRAPGVYNWRRAYKHYGHEFDHRKHGEKVLRELGLYDAVMRLWRMRKRQVSRAYYTDEYLLGVLAAEAERMGHTPTLRNWSPNIGLPSMTTYVYRFGSVARAQELAGLVPNQRGRRPHKLPRR